MEINWSMNLTTSAFVSLSVLWVTHVVFLILTNVFHVPKLILQLALSLSPLIPTARGLMFPAWKFNEGLRIIINNGNLTMGQLFKSAVPQETMWHSPCQTLILNCPGVLFWMLFPKYVLEKQIGLKFMRANYSRMKIQTSTWID